MKKYLTLAAILGAIAFVSVSFLAQAEPETGTVTTAVEKAAEGTAPAPAASDDAAAALAKDTAECTTLAETPKTDGAKPSDAEKAEALTKCLEGKGHKAEAPKTEDKAAPAEGEKAPE